MKSGRLGMSTGMHFSWNLVQDVFFGFAVNSNSTKVSIISVDVSNNAITGGVFGPEGSVLFLCICVIAVILLLLWKKIKGYSALVNPLLIRKYS
ncbi:hypothetical protein [Aquimarina sp. Aq78]|uniref:hypothetical protein n=1 Tax=Aquimarina sp. Aq78 TaxID=1191889 RepID=UPI00131C36DB|nr:hypothetical protein [Aquimarina sp. Aq78]